MSTKIIKERLEAENEIALIEEICKMKHYSFEELFKEMNRSPNRYSKEKKISLEKIINDMCYCRKTWILTKRW